MSEAAGRAAFLDRDGTIIVEAGYPSDPHQVVLLPGSARALVRLKEAGYVIIVVTNQSGMARGLYGRAEFNAVQARVEQLLAAEGATIDAVFHCPHHPDHTGPCDCRKPALGLYRRAATLHGVDLASSVYIGDKLSDVVPGLELGGRSFLVRTGYGEGCAERVPPGVIVVDDLDAAAHQIAENGETAAVDTPGGSE